MHADCELAVYMESRIIKSRGTDSRGGTLIRTQPDNTIHALQSSTAFFKTAVQPNTDFKCILNDSGCGQSGQYLYIYIIFIVTYFTEFIMSFRMKKLVLETTLQYRSLCLV